MVTLSNFQKIDDDLWEISKDYRPDMLVPARVYATKKMLEAILDEKAINQLINITTLPGIFKYSLAMPDIHQGYGFPIGSVAAVDLKNGVITPGGIGYDINCGVRLLASPLTLKDLKPHIEKLTYRIHSSVPAGVGSTNKNIPINLKELDKILNTGISWALKKGFALNDDHIYIEENGHFKVADANNVSIEAKKRGIDQLGTLGSGNHFLEIQVVDQVYDENTAKVFGISQGQITVMIHTGSRGLGHQTCSDYIKLFKKANPNIAKLVDRELVHMPFNSQEGKDYFSAMAAAANFAWVNRQIITDIVRKTWIQIFGGDKEQLQLIYDVAHNIAKIENHFDRKLLVHRKGATRAFGPQHSEIPEKYKASGQPVFIPGSMGTCSYVLAGTEEAMQHSFGSVCHGAGRRMSRAKSKKTLNLTKILEKMKKDNIVVCSDSARGLLEEAPESYKDVNEVVEVITAKNIGRKVAKLKPIGVVKG